METHQIVQNKRRGVGWNLRLARASTCSELSLETWLMTEGMLANQTQRPGAVGLSLLNRELTKELAWWEIGCLQEQDVLSRLVAKCIGSQLS